MIGLAIVEVVALVIIFKKIEIIKFIVNASVIGVIVCMIFLFVWMCLRVLF